MYRKNLSVCFSAVICSPFLLRIEISVGHSEADAITCNAVCHRILRHGSVFISAGTTDHMDIQNRTVHA